VRVIFRLLKIVVESRPSLTFQRGNVHARLGIEVRRSAESSGTFPCQLQFISLEFKNEQRCFARQLLWFRHSHVHCSWMALGVEDPDGSFERISFIAAVELKVSVANDDLALGAGVRRIRTNPFSLNAAGRTGLCAACTGQQQTSYYSRNREFNRLHLKSALFRNGFNFATAAIPRSACLNVVGAT